MNDEIIKQYVNADHPFGPLTTDVIRDESIMSKLFDRENKIYQELTKRPAFIIGRKGSGKTAFLRNIKLENEYKVIVEIKTYEAFAYVLETIEKLSTKLIFVEAVADIWEIIARHATFHQIIKNEFGKPEDLTIIKKYLNAIGIAQSTSIDEAVKKSAFVLHKKSTDSIGSVTDYIESLTFAGVSYEGAQEAANRILNQAKTRAVILMDSMEDFALEQNTIAHALSGLFKCIARLSSPESNCEIRFCFPSELWHTLFSLSINPMKDFEHNLILHWHAGELLSIAAHRLALYLHLYEPALYQAISHFNLDDRKGAQDLLRLIFPDDFRNAIGGLEDVFPYIVRHTQLLPRQLFRYLNGIFVKNRRLGRDFLKITPEAIIQGIAEQEKHVTGEIFAAFRYVYPNAEEVCRRTIPELPYIFPYNQLHKVFNRHTKKAMAGGDLEDFIKMLIEMGCIGRVINETDRYFIGEFEYTRPARLVISTSDTLCLHPVFCRIYSAKKPGNDGKVIYPYGSDIEGLDHREW
jgi:hypothetical protein